MFMSVSLMSGCESKNEKGPNGKERVVVAMTANAFDEDRKTAKKFGMNDFISKPINFEEVVRIFKKYL